MVQTFYAQMGGEFVVELNDLLNSQNKWTPFRVTLTARGMCLLAKLYCNLPPISKAFITDKSKANSLAKLLVCVQVVCCLLQYIGRVASHL
jgi:hypothetical protein